MKVVAKPILIFTIVSYVFASSVAAAHAFPKNQLGLIADVISAATVDTSVAGKPTDAMPSCHRSLNMDEGYSTTCDIFCAALGSLVVYAEPLQYFRHTKHARVEFMHTKARNIAIQRESRPPK